MKSAAGVDRQLAAVDDIVGDRHQLLRIGMIAVFVACAVFTLSRLTITLRTGKATPWWVNAAGALAIAMLFAWYYRRPQQRSARAASGTALVATIALVVPVCYGMTSSIWWLSLVGFAMVLLGRRGEAWIWGVSIPLLVAVASLLEPWIQIQGAAGEPALEHALARGVFVVILIAMAAAFRRVADQRAVALFESEQRYRMLFQRAPVGVVHCDQTGQLIDSNDRLTEILGGRRDQLAGSDIGAVFKGGLASAIEAALAGRPGSYDGPQHTSFGQPGRSVSARAVALRHEDQTLAGALCIVEDTTSRQEMERQLQQAHAELEQRVRVRTAELQRSRAVITNILDSIPQFVFWKDTSGKYLGCNQFFAQAAGLSRTEEIIGRCDGDLPWSAHAAEYRADDREVIEKRRSKRGVDERFRHADGRQLWVATSKVPLIDETGAVYGILGVFDDITDRKQLEAQLRQAQKLDAIGRLAGGIAHDFNNLLQAMLSQIALIRRESRDHDPELIALEAHAQRGGALARQLLMFSRPEQARREVLDLNQLVRETATLLGRLLRENVTLIEVLDDRSLTVAADHTQLEQVLINLAVNGADAMPEGGQLTIRTGRHETMVWFEVEDMGVGIPEAARDKLFEPFYTTKAAARGTGLGLSVVHGIVAGHGGRIELTSSEGAGSTFRVWLPESAGGQQPHPAVVADERTIQAGHGESILVIEDEAGIREGLHSILTSLGYSVTAIGSVFEADQVPGLPAVRVLITDIMLPDGNGVALAHKMLHRWPDLRIILMSGYSEDEALRDADRLASARFLQKPFSMTTLGKTVREVLAMPPAPAH